MRQITAEEVYRGFTQLPAHERARFFALLAEPVLQTQNFSHEQLFGHLAEARFTAQEAAEYLGVSIATFRRYVADRKLKPVGEIGRSQLFATRELKTFKRSLQDIRARRAVSPA